MINSFKSRSIWSFLLSIVLFLLSKGYSQIPQSISITPQISTAPVNYKAKDVAIWIHPNDPGQSLVIGTDVGGYPTGGIFVWNLDGTLQQRINIAYPPNVDVEYSMLLGGEYVDIAVVTMRNHGEIRVFKIDPDSRTLSSITSSKKIEPFFSPYSLALFKKPDDGKIFAFVSDKPGTEDEDITNIWQIQLQDDGNGLVEGSTIRTIGDTSTSIEGMVADDELGYLYVAKNKVGIEKYFADPAKGDNRLAVFATDDGRSGYLQGLTLYKCTDKTGYIISSTSTGPELKVYRREGEENNPHLHQLVTTFNDPNSAGGFGVCVTGKSIPDLFPGGFLVWKNTINNNFNLYSWEEIAKSGLKLCTF